MGKFLRPNIIMIAYLLHKRTQGIICVATVLCMLAAVSHASGSACTNKNCPFGKKYRAYNHDSEALTLGLEDVKRHGISCSRCNGIGVAPIVTGRPPLQMVDNSSYDCRVGQLRGWAKDKYPNGKKWARRLANGKKTRTLAARMGEECRRNRWP